MYFMLGIILGASIAIFLYETYFEKRGKKVGSLLAPKIEELIEVSSMNIAKKQKELKRELNEDEKNIILDECYKNM